MILRQRRFADSIEKSLQPLVDALAENPGVKFWYRDDDVACGDVMRLANLNQACLFSVQNGIEALFAVIPEGLLENENAEPVRCLKKWGVKVAMHGVSHTDNGGMNEFPEDLRDAEYEEKLIFYHGRMAEIFGAQYTGGFVAPFNNLSDHWAKIIEMAGFSFISGLNRAGEKQSAWNVDYDLINWESGRYKPFDQVCLDLAELIQSGSRRIGIMNHHWLGGEQIWPLLTTIFQLRTGRCFSS